MNTQSLQTLSNKTTKVDIKHLAHKYAMKLEIKYLWFCLS